MTDEPLIIRGDFVMLKAGSPKMQVLDTWRDSRYASNVEYARVVYYSPETGCIEKQAVPTEALQQVPE